jgi:hypothetical protein
VHPTVLLLLIVRGESESGGLLCGLAATGRTVAALPGTPPE